MGIFRIFKYISDVMFWKRLVHVIFDTRYECCTVYTVTCCSVKVNRRNRFFYVLVKSNPRQSPRFQQLLPACVHGHGDRNTLLIDFSCQFPMTIITMLLSRSRSTDAPRHTITTCAWCAYQSCTRFQFSIRARISYTVRRVCTLHRIVPRSFVVFVLIFAKRAVNVSWYVYIHVRALRMYVQTIIARDVTAGSGRTRLKTMDSTRVPVP